MQQTQQQTERMNGSGAGLSTAVRRRVETVVETLANLHGRGETLAEVAHDARNMVTALGIYCELLDEPGVLSPQFRHYGNELRLVSAASRRLVEKLIALDAGHSDACDSDACNSDAGHSDAGHPDAGHPAAGRSGTGRAGAGRSDAGRAGDANASAASTFVASTSASAAASYPAYDPFERGRLGAAGQWDLLPAVPIRNLAREVLASRNLLAALAGPAIALTVEAESGALPVRLSGEDLTRVLVNLVRNAAEAMPRGGRIRIVLREQSTGGAAGPGKSGPVESVALTIEDNGPGIAADALEAVFASGYSTHSGNAGQPARAGDRANTGLSAPANAGRSAASGHPATHGGLGLAISRSIVEAAGGRIHVLPRATTGGSLSGTSLSGAGPSGTRMPGASLSGARTPGADPSEASPSEASQAGANSTGASPSGAGSTGACFEIVLPVASR